MIDRIAGTATYSIEIARKLFKKGMVADPNFDYLTQIQQGKINQEHREKLHNWIFNICDGVGASQHTKELACILTDRFLSTTPTKKSFLQLIGTCSIQIAIKCNESFEVENEALAEACGNCYSATQIAKFEEVMLNLFGWDVNMSTSWEITKNLSSAIKQLSINNLENKNEDCVSIADLAKVLLEEEIISKIKIFNQIAILDYNMTRFGSSILGVLSPLFVLKNQGKLAECSTLLQVASQLAPAGNFLRCLKKAEEVTERIFQKPQGSIVSTSSSSNCGSQPQNPARSNSIEVSNNSLNQSQEDDRASNLTNSSSNASSPIPPILHSNKGDKLYKKKEGNLEQNEGDKHKKMFQKKRKVICKQML